MQFFLNLLLFLTFFLETISRYTDKTNRYFFLCKILICCVCHLTQSSFYISLFKFSEHKKEKEKTTRYFIKYKISSNSSHKDEVQG